METMIKTSSNMASNSSHDKLPDDDAMDVGTSEIRKSVHTKRSRSLTPNVGHSVKSRKLDFAIPDPEEVLNNVPVLPSNSAIPAAATDETSLNDDIIENINPAELGTCILPRFDRFLYISQFKPETSETKIKNFIVEKLKCKPEAISCQKLISAKRNPLLPLSFVSFKVGTSKNLAKKILKKNFWPAGLTAKAFEERSKNANTQRQDVGRMKTAPNNPHHRSDSYVRSQANNNFVTNLNNPVRNNNRRGQPSARRNHLHAPVGLQQRQANPAMTWRVSQH